VRPRVGFTKQIVRALALFAFALPLALACNKAYSPNADRRGSEGTLVLPDVVSQPAPPMRVLLISVAGLAPEFYRGAEGAAPWMPVSAALARAGVSADAIEVVSPDAVYPSHATLVTGQRPDKHGIVSDHLLGERGVRASRFSHASRLGGSSLWQEARDANLSVVALGWPSTVGASIDWLLPDLAPLRPGQSWLEVMTGAATPWLLEIATRAAPADGDPSWPSPAQRDALIVDMACELAFAPEAAPALWLLRLEGGGEALPRHGPGSEAARAAFATVDRRIGTLLGCLDDASLLDTSALLLVGDQSVRPVHTRIDPNVALAEARLVALDRKAGGIRSWSAIARSNGGSAFVYARSQSAALRAREALGVEAERTRGFRVISAAEVRERHGDPQAWFGLEALPGFVFGDGAEAPLQRPAEARAAGGYSAGEGSAAVGFVAWGRAAGAAPRRRRGAGTGRTAADEPARDRAGASPREEVAVSDVDRVVIELNPHERRFYDRVRSQLVDPEPAASSGVRDLLLLLPDLTALCFRLLRDPRVSKRRKAVAALALAYVVTPIDLFPVLLFGPIGLIDDLFVVGSALSHLMGGVHPDVVRSHWPGQGDALEVIQRVTSWTEAQLRFGVRDVFRLRRRPQGHGAAEGA